MKIKDLTDNWLLVDSRSGSYTDHFFDNKSKSVCGQVRHPKFQPDVAFVTYETCRKCQGILKHRAKGEENG
jgi:hypothetical protein